MDTLGQSLTTNTSLHFLSAETFATLSKFTALQLVWSYTANTHWSFRLSSSHLVLILGCVLEKNLKHFTVNVIPCLSLQTHKQEVDPFHGCQCTHPSNMFTALRGRNQARVLRHEPSEDRGAICRAMTPPNTWDQGLAYSTSLWYCHFAMLLNWIRLNWFHKWDCKTRHDADLICHTSSS